jgi:hypothetical protein
MIVHLEWKADPRVVSGDGKPARLCLECRRRGFAHPRSSRLAAFSRPLSRCYPLSYRPPLLRLFCVNETSSAQRAIYAPFPAPAETAQGRCKERSMRRGILAHLQALLLPGRYRASVVGTVPAQLRFLLYTLLLDLKHDATDRFMNRHPHRCLHTARKEDELVF